MPKATVDCRLVSTTNVAANVKAIVKILRPIWVPRTSFWVFRGGFCGNLASRLDIVRILGERRKMVVGGREKTEQEKGIKEEKKCLKLRERIDGQSAKLRGAFIEERSEEPL